MSSVWGLVFSTLLGLFGGHNQVLSASVGSWALPNNKFGLYIYSVNDYASAAATLVNSNGGDWGYVLVPYAVYDTDIEKWRGFFLELHKDNLIPIIQLWDLRNSEDTQHAAEFLDSLPWPTTIHYVSVYNEPNDSRFWYNKVDPAGYAAVLDQTITTFKKQNSAFFMLNGAFNASARNGNGYMDEVDYVTAMNKAVPGIFKRLDGWASHPYPQPNFSGSLADTGRDSIKAYDWELSLLKDKFGVNNLPVFITETGWAHQEGVTPDYSFYTADQTAALIKEAYEQVWLPDPRIIAVTPFTIKYSHPEDHFNWLDPENKPYPQFYAIQQMPKVAGKPTESPWYLFYPDIRQIIIDLFDRATLRVNTNM
ncbi:MAG: hypothetical protein NT141_03795 [candidate division WWE3 bacterium]|nr:hypothetical protein [candidate division WWE3 bacterium]